MFRFEKLSVWQKAIDFAMYVYEMTNGFPVDERFGLTSQMRRTAVSVSSNIAEGSGRLSGKDRARFIEMDYSSLMEVVSQAELAHRLTLLPQEYREDLYEKADELARMLSGLKSSILNS